MESPLSTRWTGGIWKIDFQQTRQSYEQVCFEGQSTTHADYPAPPQDALPMQTMLIPAKLLVFQTQFWEEADLKSPVHSEITKHHLWKRYARCCKAVMSSQKLRNHQCDLMVSPACMLTTKLPHWKAYKDGCKVVDWDRKRFLYWQNHTTFVFFPKQCGHTEGFLR